MRRVLLFSLLLCAVCIGAEEDNVLIIEDFVAQQSQNIEWNGRSIRLAKDATLGLFVSCPILNEQTFNACTISWQGSKNIALQIRVSHNGKQWNVWQNCDQERDFLWIDASYNFLQVRAVFQRKNIQQNLYLKKIVIMHNNISPALLVAEPSREIFRAVAKPAIISRAQWGARPPKGNYSSHTPKKITIHHTWRPKASSFVGSSTIKNIQDYHMDSNGWMDIGYHFLIGTYPSTGKTVVYQGRPENKIGAHTGGHNTTNVGVNAIGDYTTENLHPKTYAKLVEVIAWLCYQYKISPDNIYGHRDFGSTACPGDILYAKLPQIKADVRKKLQGK